MGGNTIFRCPVHFHCSNLHFKRLPQRSNQSSVQGLIIIWFRHGNIVFKSALNRLIFFVNDTQCRIAVLYTVYNNPHSKKIKYLVKGFVLGDHLLIYTKGMFHPPVYMSLNFGLLHESFNFLHKLFDSLFSLTELGISLALHLMIFLWLQVF